MQPHDFNEEDVVTEEKFTFFFRSKLGQWNMTPFTTNRVEYNCAEQYMMAQKALLFRDWETYGKIMDATHPRDQKRLGREVKNFNLEVWEKHARDIVFEANFAKFTQNDELWEILKATEGTTLVEASPYDPIWGIKMDASDPDRFDRSKWKGKNWLGETLTKVRETILALGSNTYKGI